MIRILSILLCLTLLSSNIKAQQLTDRQALCLKGQVKRVTYSVDFHRHELSLLGRIIYLQ